MMLAVAFPTLAQSLRVVSGDHDGFTRLVVLGNPGESWRLGRTPEGYGLQLGRSVRFDLTDAFRLIDRSRVAAIWVDPQNGLLRMRVSCACHAFATQEGDGMIVIDVRDGSPPPGSIFEQAIIFGDLAILSDIEPPRPQARPPEVVILGPEWAKAVSRAVRIPTADLFQGLSSSDPAASLAEALTVELARGAARGLVDFAPVHREKAGEGAETPAGLAVYPFDRGIDITLSPDEPKYLAAKGGECIADELVDIANWGDDRPIWQQFAEATASPDEFDVPNAERRNRAVQRLLYAGFGIEARRLVEAMPLPDGGHDALYLELAGIMDADPVRNSALAGQESCDGAIAMWAVMATDTGNLTRPNLPSIRRGFSALPLHLRQQLGPDLVRRLISVGEAASAADIQAAMERAPGPLPNAVLTSAAELELQVGDPEAALDMLERSPDGGPGSMEALIAQVEANARLKRSMDAHTVERLEALVTEYSGTGFEPSLRRALVLAQALTGKFGSAIAGLTAAPSANEAVWGLLATADDDTVLLHAVGAPSDMTNALSLDTRIAVASRLIDLGLGPAALEWLGTPPADALVGARAALLTGDARAALRLLAGSSEAGAEELRSLATAQLFSAGSDRLAAPSEPTPRMAAWLGDWEEVAADGESPWKELASQAVSGEVPFQGGLLARGKDVLESAEATRRAITGLMTYTEQASGDFR